MKNYILLIISFFSFGFVHSQKFKDLDKSPLDMIQFPGNRGESQWARILYSRPQLKGEIFLLLFQKVKFGEWEQMNLQN